MTETLYWITRLNGIHTFGLIITVISVLVAAFSCISYIGSKADGDDDVAAIGAKILKISTLTLLIGSLIIVFVPTTKEALLIYGVGNTIEYIKSNEKAQQLPDKCIDALDAWVEELNKEKKE